MQLLVQQLIYKIIIRYFIQTAIFTIFWGSGTKSGEDLTGKEEICKNKI
jgi:hypothetical protein